MGATQHQPEGLESRLIRSSAKAQNLLRPSPFLQAELTFLIPCWLTARLSSAISYQVSLPAQPDPPALQFTLIFLITHYHWDKMCLFLSSFPCCSSFDLSRAHIAHAPALNSDTHSSMHSYRRNLDTAKKMQHIYELLHFLFSIQTRSISAVGFKMNEPAVLQRKT